MNLARQVGFEPTTSWFTGPRLTEEDRGAAPLRRVLAGRFGLAILHTKRDECGHHGKWADHMQMETKYLHLRDSVELGTRFGDWQVCWLGGWARFRLYYLVMLVKIPLPAFPQGCDEATVTL